MQELHADELIAASEELGFVCDDAEGEKLLLVEFAVGLLGTFFVELVAGELRLSVAAVLV